MDTVKVEFRRTDRFKGSRVETIIFPKREDTISLLKSDDEVNWIVDNQTGECLYCRLA